MPIIDPTTLTNEQIAQDLMDDKSTSEEIQKEAGKRLLSSSIDPFEIPEPIKLTPEQLEQLEAQMAEQNKPKSYSKVQFLSVPQEYRQDYPELFQIQERTVVDKVDQVLTITGNVQKIKLNNQIDKSDLNAVNYKVLEPNYMTERYVLQCYCPTENPENFEDMRFYILLEFQEQITFNFTFWDGQNGVAQYLFVSAK